MSFDIEIIKDVGLVTETPVIITNQDAYIETSLEPIRQLSKLEKLSWLLHESNRNITCRDGTLVSEKEMSDQDGWSALFWTNHDQPCALNRFVDIQNFRNQGATMLAASIHPSRGILIYG